MNGWRWQLEVLAVRHGLWLLPALALLLCALGAWLVWLPAERARLLDAERALTQRQEGRRMAARQAPMPGLQLPPPAQSSAGVQRLFELARQHGLTIAQADYRRQDSGAVGRWQVQVPATGSYPQVRYFVRAAQAIPGLSLDELNLQRAGGKVEARMLFSIWYDGTETGQ